MQMPLSAATKTANQTAGGENITIPDARPVFIKLVYVPSQHRTRATRDALRNARPAVIVCHFRNGAIGLRHAYKTSTRIPFQMRGVPTGHVPRRIKRESLHSRVVQHPVGKRAYRAKVVLELRGLRFTHPKQISVNIRLVLPRGCVPRLPACEAGKLSLSAVNAAAVCG